MTHCSSVVFVWVCVSTHLTGNMASCFSYLHGCRIIDALREKALWQQVAGAKHFHKTQHTGTHNTNEQFACERFRGLVIHSVVIGDVWLLTSSFVVIFCAFLFCSSILFTLTLRLLIPFALKPQMCVSCRCTIRNVKCLASWQRCW